MIYRLPFRGGSHLIHARTHCCGVVARQLQWSANVQVCQNVSPGDMPSTSSWGLHLGVFGRRDVHLLLPEFCRMWLRLVNACSILWPFCSVTNFRLVAREGILVGPYLLLAVFMWCMCVFSLTSSSKGGAVRLVLCVERWTVLAPDGMKWNPPLLKRTLNIE